jgi:hypothetical protein
MHLHATGKLPGEDETNNAVSPHHLLGLWGRRSITRAIELGYIISVQKCTTTVVPHCCKKQSSRAAHHVRGDTATTRVDPFRLAANDDRQFFIDLLEANLITAATSV